MRCPYCGGLNPDKTQYCIRCGRDVTPQLPSIQRQPALTPQQPAYPPPPAHYQQPVAQRPPAAPPANRPPMNRAPVPQQAPPYRAPQPVQRPQYPAPANPQATSGVRTQARHHTATTLDQVYTAPQVQSAEPSGPEAPAPFPPKTVEQLRALLSGALDYTLVTDNTGYGKKKIVRIAYRRCAPWQQVATLLKALKEYDAQKFDTVVLQGVHENDTTSYTHTNGQIIFDRNVRLGSQLLHRYQIETGNGFASDAIRIVLTEPMK